MVMENKKTKKVGTILLAVLVVLLVALAVLMIYGISANNWAEGMSVVSVLLIAATTGSFMVSVPLFVIIA